jgi:hypothetical protein
MILMWPMPSPKAWHRLRKMSRRSGLRCGGLPVASARPEVFRHPLPLVSSWDATFRAVEGKI